MATESIDLELHHPVRRKLLLALAAAPGAVSKSMLAEKVYGRSDSSTRSMISRITATLTALGVIDEEFAGRERLVRITERGRVIAASWGSTAVPLRAIDVDALTQEPPDDHPTDRPRFHLRHAALHALDALRRRSTLTSADEHYQHGLAMLIDERSQSSPQDDRQEFYRLARSWPADDHARLLLLESLVRFQFPAERRATVHDLIAVGDLLTPGADAVLWATAAISVAHQLIVEPRSIAERIAARGLIQTAVDRLRDSARQEPDLGVAVAYRLAKATKVLLGGWAWTPPPAVVIESSDPVKQAIAAANREVTEAGNLNQVLEPFDQTLDRVITPLIMTTHPGVEPLFRMGHTGAAHEVVEWAEDRKDTLAELLNRRAQRDPELRRVLLAFRANVEPYTSNPMLNATIAPHLRQTAGLIGDAPVAALPTPLDLRDQIMNNLWTTPMVMVHVAAQVA